MFFPLSVLACATCANSFKHGGQNAAGWAIALMLMVIVPLAVMVLFFYDPNRETREGRIG